MSEQGKFVWFELITRDNDKAKAFYGEVFGWKVETLDMNGMKYPMVKVGDKGIGGFAPPPKPDLPPHWVSYVAVDDVDAAAKKVTAAGGKSLMEAFEVPGVGRMQPVTDAEGAAFFLFKGADGPQPEVKGIGSFHWNELWARDVDAAKGFYEKVLGYTTKTMDMPNGPYVILEQNGEPRGGLMAAPAEEIPPHWTQYITVDDVDACLDRVKKHGGKVVGEPMEVPGVGRFAHILDNVGAAIAVIAPAEA